MIKFIDQLQAFACKGCGYLVEVSRAVIADQNRYIAMRERLEDAHKDCK